LKCTNVKNNSTIFKIDNKTINANYEKYTLRIIVEKFKNKYEKLNVNIINLTTKTPENIKKSKELIIRGKTNLQ
jgi:hypothetical protein